MKTDQKYYLAKAVVRIQETRLFCRLASFCNWWVRDRVLVLLTFVLATTTIVYATFSYEQWQTMQRQLELSERAWIAPCDKPENSIVINKDQTTLTLIRAICNSGHSPATLVRHSSESGLASYPLRGSVMIKGNFEPDGSIFPDGSTDMTARGHLLPGDVAKLASGSFAWIFYGKIHYRNGLDDTMRTTPYCLAILFNSWQSPTSKTSKIFAVDCSPHVDTAGDVN